MPAYGASKAGLHSLTQALAVQYGPQNIRCNTIAPGFVVTKKTRLMGEDFFRMTLDSNALPFLGEPEDKTLPDAPQRFTYPFKLSFADASAFGEVETCTTPLTSFAESQNPR